jgi:hypothetical protein
MEKRLPFYRTLLMKLVQEYTFVSPEKSRLVSFFTPHGSGGLQLAEISYN